MPPSFRIVPRRAEDVDLVGERFRNAPGVEKDGVQYARDVVKPLLAVTNFAQAVLWIMAVGSLVAGVLLILNTIRMAIFNRRREVAVMKLVGATNWFIRVPFMLEGMVQGVVGALVAAAIVWGGRNLIQSWIQGARNLQLFKQFYVSTHDVVGTAIFLVVLGAIVGAAGSAVGVNRFLDV
jgi:cell division transport system permease protein